MEEDRSSMGTINLVEDGKPVVDLSGGVHQLPCCVKFDGPCEVSHYFKPKSTGVEADGLKVEEAHFRGRRLQGATISLPSAYSGYVLRRVDHGKRKASEMTEHLSWETKAKFDRLSFWNHDSLPSKDDPFLRSFHWFAIAEALHKPVTPADLLNSSTAAGKH